MHFAKMRNLLGSITMVLISTVIALVAAELLVRWLLPQDVAAILNIYVEDEKLQYGFKPNASARQTSAEFDVAFTTNSQGFRDHEYPPAKAPGMCRIMVFGDSFSAGQGVAEEATYATVLERLLNEDAALGSAARWEVINASVIGYHLWHYTKGIEVHASTFDTDLAVIGFFVGNDFGGHDPGLRRIIRNGYLGRYERPMRDIGGSDFSVRLKRALTPLLEALAMRSQLYVLVRKAATPALAAAGLMDDQFAFNLEPYRKTPKASVETWYAETDALLATAAQRAQAAGTQLLVMVIPDRFQVDDALWSGALGSLDYNPDALRVDEPNRRLVAMATGKSLVMLDLLGPLRASPAQVRYFPKDYHWNAAGHEFAARELLARLRLSLARGENLTRLRCLQTAAGQSSP